MTTELWLRDKKTMKRMQNPVRQKKRKKERKEKLKSIKWTRKLGVFQLGVQNFIFLNQVIKKWKEVTVKIGAPGTCEVLVYKSQPP